MIKTSPILHIEDEDASAYLLQAALDEAGVSNRTFRVSSGEEGLAFLCKSGAYQQAKTPGLVILDLNMPGIDGWMVLNVMQRQSELRTIPVVILSSSDSEADRSRALRLGARHYLLKEQDIAAMGRALQETCPDFLDIGQKGTEAFPFESSTLVYDRELWLPVRETENAANRPDSPMAPCPAPSSLPPGL